MSSIIQASLRRLPPLGASLVHSQRGITTSSISCQPSSSKASQASLTQVPSFSEIVIPASMVTNPTVSRRERRKAHKERKKAAIKRQYSESTFAKAGLKAEQTSPFARKDRQFKTFKPLTPSLRWVRTSIQPHIYKGKPVRALTMAKRNKGGRNHHGHITVRGRGGGHKRRIRLVDFYRWERGIQSVIRIEYDPNRSAHLALIEHQETKRRSYILAPEGLREGDTVESYRSELQEGEFRASSTLDLGIFRTKAIRPGNVLPLKLIPIGTTIHALSLLPHGSAKLVRSAGTYGQLVAFVNRSKAKPKPAGSNPSSISESDVAAATLSTLPGLSEQVEYEDVVTDTLTQSTTHAQVKLQSGEVRLVLSSCCATIGRVSNADHEHERLGKAGRSRWLGRKPKVRGVAMNAVDHPHGGGRGKSKSNMHPKSIYGNKTKGPRTRKPGTKNGNQMVIRERPRNNGMRASKVA
jgi:ribosomal protein L2